MKNDRTNKWIDYIFNIDRRVVYLFIFIMVALPFFFKPVVSIRTTERVRNVYNLVEEAAKLNKPIIIGIDFDPSTIAELKPMAVALLRHAFMRDVKVLGINFLVNGTTLGADVMDTIAKEYGKEYGKDYAYFGYIPQMNIVLLNFCNDFRKSYEKDYRGNPVDDIPMLKDYQNFDDFHVVVDLSGTKIPQTYIFYGVNRCKFNFAAGVTAVSATEYFPYLHSGQMKGLMAGMKAAAEYEGLIGKSDKGMRGMAAQTWGHLTIIAFIIVGNILYYIKKSRDRKLEEKA